MSDDVGTLRERIMRESKAAIEKMRIDLMVKRIIDATGAKSWEEAIERVEEWAGNAWADGVTQRELVKAQRLLARLMEATCTDSGEDAVQVVEAMCTQGYDPDSEE